MHNWQRTILGILIACMALASVPAHAESGVRAGSIVQAGADQYTVGDCSRVDKAQVGVSMLGNIFRSFFLPLKSASDTSFRSASVSRKSGARLPTAGRLPLV